MYRLLKKIVLSYKTYLAFFTSLVLLWLTIKQSHLSYTSFQFDGHQIRLFCYAIMVFIITIMVQAQRSKFIWIRRIKDLSHIKMYGSIILGNFYNCILPGNLGEGVRAWHFHRKNHVSFSNSIAAIGIEKLVDAQLFIPVVILINFMHPPSRSDYAVIALNITVVFILLADIFLIILLRYGNSARWLWALVPGTVFRKNLFRLLFNVKNHVYRLYESGWIWVYAPLGYVMFGLNIFQYELLLKACSVGFPVLGLYSLLLVSCCMVVVAFLPSAPSGIGVVHYGIYTALCNSASILGVKIEMPLLQKFAATATLLHASYFLPEVILGGVFFFRERKWLL